MKCKIKKGAKVFQDFRVFIYPELDTVVDLDTIFEVKILNGTYYNCVAPGFGGRGNYGCGSIFLYNINDLEIIEEIGHIIETSADTGLALCMVHLN